MNSRIAKKIMCCPVDPSARKSLATTPYTGAQWDRAGAVYARALRRGRGAVRRPRCQRNRWRRGFVGAMFYGKEGVR